jgi:hypothetical protein
MALYVAELVKRWRAGEIDGSQKRDLAIIAANMALFGVLLATDYQE